MPNPVEFWFIQLYIIGAPKIPGCRAFQSSLELSISRQHTQITLFLCVLSIHCQKILVFLLSLSTVQVRIQPSSCSHERQSAKSFQGPHILMMLPRLIKQHSWRSIPIWLFPVNRRMKLPLITKLFPTTPRFTIIPTLIQSLIILIPFIQFQPICVQQITSYVI